MIKTLALLGVLALSGPLAAQPADPSTLAKVLAGAKMGGTIALAPGSYGDVPIYNSRTPNLLTLTCADPARPPVLRSLTINNSANVVVTCLQIAFTPDAKTVTWSSAVTIDGSQDVTLRGVRISGAPAITGALPDAAVGASTGNVIGWPTARGVSVQNAARVRIEGGEISGFHRGIFFHLVEVATLTGVDIHDLRATAIVGANVRDLTIQGNTLRDAHPWRWGETPLGDHADFIALWADSGQTQPNGRVKILDNLVVQDPKLPAVLGLWFQGGDLARFTDFEISRNRMFLNNLQAIALWNAGPGLISGNSLLRNGPVEKQAPAILLRSGVTGVAVSGNTLSQISDQSGGVNPQSGNIIVSGMVTRP